MKSFFLQTKRKKECEMNETRLLIYENLYLKTEHFMCRGHIKAI